MPGADVTYADVKFKSKTTRTHNRSSPADAVYSEVRVPRTQQEGGSNGRSKVTSKTVFLLVLIVLMAAVLVVLCVYVFMTLGKKNEDQGRNPSEMKTSSTVPPTPNQTSPKREAVWEEHGGTCYFFSYNKFSWQGSRHFCRDLGGDLVKISSREEQEFLLGRLRDLNTTEEDKFWIGLTDSETEGRWFWVDGSPLSSSLTFWNSGQPDGSSSFGGEDCVVLEVKNRGGDLNTWNDHSCLLLSRRICEKSAESEQRSSV